MRCGRSGLQLHRLVSGPALGDVRSLGDESVELGPEVELHPDPVFGEFHVLDRLDDVGAHLRSAVLVGGEDRELVHRGPDPVREQTLEERAGGDLGTAGARSAGGR